MTAVAAATAPTGHGWRASFRSMASPIDVTIGPGCADPERAYREIVAVFTDVATQCTRFDPDSDLMRANRADDWTPVGGYCLDAVRAAARAHLATSGRFDPRVLRALLRLGYTHSHESGRSGGPVPARHAAFSGEPWLPEIDGAAGRIRIGPDPIDLGGIGKGLAARWAAEQVAANMSVPAHRRGRRLRGTGTSPDGGPWRLGVENPGGGDDPLAVLAVVDRACATSSVRRCRLDARRRRSSTTWSIRAPDGRAAPGCSRSPSSTTTRPIAEVWSKTLFLAGADGVAALADERGLAALWVFDSGEYACSDALLPFLIWPVPPPEAA